MNIFSRLFGRRAAVVPKEAPSVLESGASQFSPSKVTASKLPQANEIATRKELLRVVLRDTLKRHGIPAAWITGETLAATSRNKAVGIHWRLSILHWDPRLPTHLVALQNSLISRVHMFDPMAEHWIQGITWHFALEDESQCPAMPHPGSWTAAPRIDAMPDEPAVPAVPALPIADGDVIAGPVKIESPPADVKADLERLMSALDAQYEAGHQQAREYAKTEPARL